MYQSSNLVCAAINAPINATNITMYEHTNTAKSLKNNFMYLSLKVYNLPIISVTYIIIHYYDIRSVSTT
jgi:hypothetical protein